MKKYIIVGAVSGIGGWQLYVDSRYAYLEEQGIETYVLDGIKSNNQITKLEHLKCGKVKRIRELAEYPQVYTRRQIDKIIKQILTFIDYHESDECFIESTSLRYSQWGELIAQAVSGTNYCYLLHSHIENVATEEQNFFLSKKKDRLLAGMAPNTLVELFANYAELKDEEKVWIPASWQDPLCENPEYGRNVVNDVRAEIMPDQIVFGYFGTLNKPHFKKLCDFIVEFSEKHNDKQFLFVSVGSSKDGLSERYQKQIEKRSSNCNTINVEEMYPVPAALFEAMDICFASWGSARVASRANHKTIRLIDDVTITPHGVMGVTLRGVSYYNEPMINKTLEELVEELLFSNQYDTDDYVVFAEIMTPKDYRLTQHAEDLVMNMYSVKQNTYYDIYTIPLKGRRDLLLKTLYKCFGVRLTDCFIDVQRNIRLKK